MRSIHKKYLIVSAALLTLIVVAAAITLNAAVRHMHAEAENDLLSVILRTGGDLSRLEGQDTDGNSRPVAGGDDYSRLRSSCFFLARTSGAVISGIDVKQAYGLDEEQARELTERAMESGAGSGRIGQYAYLEQLGPTGSTYAFLNVTTDLLDESQLLVASVAVGAVAEALILAVLAFVFLEQVRPAEQMLEACGDIMMKSAEQMEGSAARLDAVGDAWGDPSAVAALRESVMLADTATDLHGVADAISRTGRPQSVDVNQLLIKMVDDNAMLLTERALEVHTALEDGIMLKAFPEEIRALLEILVMHALDFAEPGGSVGIDSLADGSNVAIILHYPVQVLPAVPAEQLLDGSGGRATGLSGGLYAARLLAHRNNGELRLEYLEPPALCFTLRFRRSGLFWRRSRRGV